MLKDSFGIFALKVRRARMPYRRFSPLRDIFLVTKFRQFLAIEETFSTATG
jgi:hypothetical protein